MLLHVQVLLAALATFQITTSFPSTVEKINLVDLNSNCIETEEKGKEHNKSPILLIHGLGSSLSTWNGIQQVLALRTGRRVCAVDLRNHGDSPWNNQTDVLAMAADVAHFLDKEKFEKVNLIGHSLGGKISVHYALNHPERVDSLVVEDMRPNGFKDLALKMFKMANRLTQEAIKIVPEGSTEDEARKIVIGFINKNLREMGSEEGVDENSQDFPIRCTDGKCTYVFNLDILNEEVLDGWPESNGIYEGPTLFIYGVHSLSDVGGDRRNIEKFFPNAKLVGVEEAGHLVHGNFREFEDEVIKLLKQ